MKIQGIEGLSTDQINFELQRGGRFIIFQYAVSALIITFYRPSDIYFVRPGENALGKGLPFSLLSLVAGWWGIPWGPIRTIQALVVNFRGGKDVTKEIVAGVNRVATQPPPAAPTPAKT